MMKFLDIKQQNFLPRLMEIQVVQIILLKIASWSCIKEGAVNKSFVFVISDYHANNKILS